MGVTTEKIDIDFVISTGDNFYSDGLIDAYDPAFDQSFTDIYTAPTLQKTWYTGTFLFLFLGQRANLVLTTIQDSILPMFDINQLFEYYKSIQISFRLTEKLTRLMEKLQ